MELQKKTCRKIAAIVFLGSTLATIYVLKTLQFNDTLSLTGGLFTGIITAGIWLEVSYKFLVKQATGPLHKIVKKI